MRRARGFTLVELIMVIVLLSIVATISVTFVGQSTRGVIDTAARQQRGLSAVVVSERLTRALREALPNSIRTNGTCIEWMPISAASAYKNLPKGGTPDSFEAAALVGGASAQGRVVVYGYNNDLYTSGSPGPISPPATMPAAPPPPPPPPLPNQLVTVTFDGGATHRFNTNSPTRRFYLVEDPVTICQSGQYLYRYQNYGLQPTIASSLPTTMPNREVLAAGLQAGSMDFRVTPATLQRAAVIAYEFTLVDSESGESLVFSQEVQVRNVP